jgi:hypothetical protein
VCLKAFLSDSMHILISSWWSQVEVRLRCSKLNSSKFSVPRKGLLYPSVVECSSVPPWTLWLLYNLVSMSVNMHDWQKFLTEIKFVLLYAKLTSILHCLQYMRSTGKSSKLNSPYMYVPHKPIDWLITKKFIILIS